MSAPTPPDSSPQNSKASGNEPVLPEKHSGRRPRRGLLASLIGIAVIVVAAIVVTVVVVNKAPAKAAGTKAPTVVSIGVVDATESYWKIYEKLALQKLNVQIKLVNFSDYTQPNPALSQGQTDLNLFQHIQYLANYNVTHNDDLQPIGSTAVYPLTLYATQYKKPSEIPNGAKIAIPNDSINEARGLLVLQGAGLLKLKNGGTPFSTTNDIVSSKVSIVLVDASQTPIVVQNGSVAGAVINGNYALNAKLPTPDRIYADNASSPSAAPYLNVFVSRKADDTNPLYLKLAALYQTPSVLTEVQKDEDGLAVFRTVSAKDLQTELATVEAQERASQ